VTYVSFYKGVTSLFQADLLEVCQIKVYEQKQAMMINIEVADTKSIGKYIKLAI
jgi:hypothetical protein